MEKTLRKNSTLYRATKNSNDYTRNSPVYFLYNRNGENIAREAYTKHGGSVHTFIANRNLRLLNVGNPKSVKMLISSAKTDKQKEAIASSFRISSNGDIVLRKSIKNFDNMVVNAAHNLKYDGYIAPRLKYKNTNNSGTFHQEIALYRAGNKVIHSSDKNKDKKKKGPFNTPSPVKKIPMKLNLVPPYTSMKKRKLF